MLSQGLGPRQSVLPLLISFLFSHIVLATPSLFAALLTSSSFPHSFLSFILFAPLLFPPFPLHIFPRGLSLSPGLCLISHRENPRVRFAPRGRKFLFSPRRFSPFAFSRSIHAMTWLRPHLLIWAMHCYLTSEISVTWVWSSHSRITRNFIITYYYLLLKKQLIDHSELQRKNIKWLRK